MMIIIIIIIIIIYLQVNIILGPVATRLFRNFPVTMKLLLKNNKNNIL
jgi:hypothetical protein